MIVRILTDKSVFANKGLQKYILIKSVCIQNNFVFEKQNRNSLLKFKFFATA